MTLKGYDISNHQGGKYGGSAINSLIDGSEFLLFKATEGINYSDKYFREWANTCVERDHPFGFYHFARHNDPHDEADFFMKVTEDYHLSGIPVLDWEDGQSVDWVNRFVARYHSFRGVWPWIYANPWRFNQGGVNPKCARWAAAYQAHKPTCDQPIACWQYTSTPIDSNIFYGDKTGWHRYVIGEGEGGEDMTNEQAEQLMAVYNEVMREDDPTGRGFEMRDHDHIKWMAGTIVEVSEKLDDLSDKVNALVEMYNRGDLSSMKGCRK